ncbi:hypothetical protein ACFX12_025264 [Malus domestica]
MSICFRTGPAYWKMNTPLTPTDTNGIPSSETQPNKRRRKKSIVWEHFTIETIGVGNTRACCKQCKKYFAYITGSKLAGTSHLKRHIALGICPVSRQKNQMTPFTPSSKTGATDAPKRRPRANSGHAKISFDQERCNHEIATMIIMHEYPLHIVEQQGFISFVRTLQPQFNMVSLKAVQDDCVAIYHREKQNLLNLISGIPGRVSLTVDLWTSNQNLGYVFLRGHFIDGDWNSYRQILNVVMVPSTDSGDTFSQAILTCLSDWHLEGRLFTITLDQSLSNETIIGNLKGLLSVKNPHMLSSQLLIRNCYARVLSRLAQDALRALSGTITKVRESVKYVKTSESREEKFVQLKQQLQVPSSKNISVDNLTKWDTTYHMLVAACELREVFACLDTYDPDYNINISLEEWKQVETLCTYLMYFFDAANIVTAPTYPSANAFFPKVSEIQKALMHAAMSDDPFVSYLIRPLYEKFDKYWENCCLVLAIAVIMDPRFKMKHVESTFSEIYGENAETWIRIVDGGIHDLFLEYMMQMLTLPEIPIEEGNDGIMKTELPEIPSQEILLSSADGLQDFDFFMPDITGGQQMKSELDQYLEEEEFLLVDGVEDFDVLGWWRLNRHKYPTLSRMASDILSIPVSTVAPDSVFDTEIKRMDSYRTSLGTATLEALICAKDWIQYGPLPQPPALQESNSAVKMEF